MNTFVTFMRCRPWFSYLKLPMYVTQRWNTNVDHTVHPHNSLLLPLTFKTKPYYSTASVNKFPHQFYVFLHICKVLVRRKCVGRHHYTSHELSQWPGRPCPLLAGERSPLASSSWHQSRGPCVHDLGITKINGVYSLKGNSSYCFYDI